MGKLRTEPKVKPFLTDKEYHEHLEVLKEARNASYNNHVFWDLEKGENASWVRKAFLHVADKENINVTIRRGRGSSSLAFSFKEKEKPTSSRMSATESRNRIVKALASAKKPLQKAEIIATTGISPSTWNIRIKELMGNGKVERRGDRRDTKYSLVAS